VRFIKAEKKHDQSANRHETGNTKDIGLPCLPSSVVALDISFCRYFLLAKGIFGDP
jgi:hypothetical protein